MPGVVRASCTSNEMPQSVGGGKGLASVVRGSNRSAGATGARRVAVSSVQRLLRRNCDNDWLESRAVISRLRAQTRQVCQFVLPLLHGR